MLQPTYIKAVMIDGYTATTPFFQVPSVGSIVVTDCPEKALRRVTDVCFVRGDLESPWIISIRTEPIQVATAGKVLKGEG